MKSQVEKYMPNRTKSTFLWLILGLRECPVCLISSLPPVEAPKQHLQITGHVLKKTIGITKPSREPEVPSDAMVDLITQQQLSWPKRSSQRGAIRKATLPYSWLNIKICISCLLLLPTPEAPHGFCLLKCLLMDSVRCFFSPGSLGFSHVQISKNLIVLPSQHSVQCVFWGRVLLSSYLMGHWPIRDN